MKKKDVLHSPRILELKKGRRRVILNKIILSLIALALVFGGLIYASRIPSLNISQIKVNGNKVVEAEEIETVAKKELSGKYIWLFPRTNILFYPKNNIRKEIQEKFKRLEDVNVSLKSEGALEISVTERTASYIWCGDTPPVADSTEKPKCSFLDETGFIFDEAPYFSGEVYFKFYGVTISELDFEKLISFKKTLETMGLKPNALYAEKNGDIKIFLPSKNSSFTDPYIIFKSGDDFKDVMENLEVALNTEPLLTNFKAKYSSLLYIDLRFGNKVVYKFK